jgi:hypothetical protein
LRSHSAIAARNVAISLLSPRRGLVIAHIQDEHADAALSEVLDCLDRIRRRARQTVEFGNDDHIAGPKALHQLSRSRALAKRYAPANAVFDEHLVDRPSMLVGARANAALLIPEERAWSA